VFALFDPARFAGAEHFRQEVTDLVANVRASPAMPGAAIMLPGDPERAQRQLRLQNGIAIDDGTWKQLADFASKLGVAAPA
jgi:uncharacterized oxidoreductase